MELIFPGSRVSVANTLVEIKPIRTIKIRVCLELTVWHCSPFRVCQEVCTCCIVLMLIFIFFTQMLNSFVFVRHVLMNRNLINRNWSSPSADE